MSAFVICHFSNCLVVWMFHGRKLNVRINSLDERALLVVFREFDLSFEELLRRQLYNLTPTKSTKCND